MSPTDWHGSRWGRAGAWWVVAGAAAALFLISVLSPAPFSDRDRALIDVIGRAPATPDALFIHAAGEVWFQPLAVYPSAALMALGVGWEPALRLPAALAGVATILLTYVLALRVTGRDTIAAWAALLLLLLPGFVTQARSPGAALLVVPFVLAWLVAVMEHGERPKTWLPVAGGAALGTCVYTQPSGVLALPIYFLVGAALLHERERAYGSIALAAVGVLAVTAPVVWWLVRHPDAYADTFGRWAIHAAHVRNPWDGVVAFSRWHVMARRVGEYWHYFNPTFVFGWGLLGIGVLPMLALGGWTLGRAAAARGRALLVVALLVSPLPAVLLDVPRREDFVLVVLPFAAILAAIGIMAAARGWQSPTRGAGAQLTAPAK